MEKLFLLAEMPVHLLLKPNLNSNSWHKTNLPVTAVFSTLVHCGNNRFISVPIPSLLHRRINTCAGFTGALVRSGFQHTCCRLISMKTNRRTFLKTTTGAAIALPNIISSHAWPTNQVTPSGSALSVSANKVAGILAFSRPTRLPRGEPSQAQVRLDNGFKRVPINTAPTTPAKPPRISAKPSPTNASMPW